MADQADNSNAPSRTSTQTQRTGTMAAARNTLARAESARKKDIEKELEANLAIMEETDEDKQQQSKLKELEERMTEYLKIENKSDFEAALFKLNEDVLLALKGKGEKSMEIRKLNKKIEITNLKFQKDLLQKQKEVEDSKELIKKLNEQIKDIKSVSSEEENTLKNVLESRKGLLEKIKVLEEDISKKNQEIARVSADAEQEILKLKTEKSQALTRLTQTVVEQKKVKKGFDEEKAQLDAKIAAMVVEMEALKVVASGSKESDVKKLEELKTENANLKKNVEDLQAQNKKKMAEASEQSATQVANLEKTIASNESKITSLNAELTKSKEEKSQLQKTMAGLNTKIAALDADVAKYKKEIEDNQKKSGAASGKVTELSAEIEKLKTERDEAKKNLLNLTSESKKKEASYQESRAQLEKTVATLKKDKEALEKTLAAQKVNSSAEYEEKKKAMEQKLQLVQQELATCKKENSDLNQRYIGLIEQNEASKNQIKELKKKCAQIEAEKSRITGSLSENTIGLIKRDIQSIQSTVDTELKRTVELMKTIDRDNKILAAEVKKYQNDPNHVSSAAQGNNAKSRLGQLEHLVHNLKVAPSTHPQPPPDVFMDRKKMSTLAKRGLINNYEKQIVALTEEILTANNVTTNTKRMQVLSKRLKRIKEPHQQALNTKAALPKI